MLTFVFVQTLDLHIEKCGGVNRDAAVSFDDAYQIDFVCVLDVHEIYLELRIVREIFKSAKLVEITFPAMTDF